MELSPWLYLGVSLWGAWFSFNAHRPMKNHPQGAAWSFAAGWLTSELALHHILWQAIATAVFAAFGAFQAWPGWLGLGISGASWLALLASQRQASQTRAVCEQALATGFGSDYFSQIRPALRSQLSNEIDWLRILRPFPIRRKGVEVLKNIQFGRAGGLELHLDIYRSAQAPAEAPVLFQIHGGGWMMGSKDEQALPLMNQLAEMGWVCVTVNYRLSPHASFPEHLIDCKQALAWVKQNVAAYGGDPGFIAVTGGSAGGHLCALMGLTQNDPEYQPGFEDADTRVNCCLPYYGVYDFADRNQTQHNEGLKQVLETKIMKGSLQEIPEAWDRASPVMRVNENAPPFLLVHGSHDTLVPVLEAREFSRVLHEKSKSPHAYAELPGAQHAFELFPSLRTLQANNASCRYLALMYSRYLDAREANAQKD